ncbi:ribosome biogenesis protein BOP1 homolog [Homarus americanus]|uniref:Ribosome biogenesis protein BOP1 homolog n=1 Tax=Homarus americanus TaxID=6706 RepID=A0A8J5N8I3_HOMAM|nr:ribosome biogenesis protein BOP1 homolog [Homarus americanus]KAG7174653.1 Ribosome biogenesis protein BOP1-like [Homarus americanus]
MSEKRKREEISDSQKDILSGDGEKVNYMVNINTDDDGDSSNSEGSDIDDDDIEDVSGDEAEESDDGEVDSLDGDYTFDDNEEEGEDDDEEEEKDDNEEREDDNDDKNETENKTKVKVDAKGDGDSGIDDPSQEKLKISKSKKNLSGKLSGLRLQTTKADNVASKQENQNSSQDLGKPDEYAEDSSDEEDLRNTIGNVPVKWYDEYPHLGYDLEGKQIIKPKRGDTLDNFLNRLENPDFDRTVFDKQTGQDVRLSDEDLATVKSLMTNRVPSADYDYYAPWVDHFTHEVMEMPLTGRTESKKSFVPPKYEATYVAKRAEQIRRGLIQYTKKKEERYRYYNLWSDAERTKRGISNHLPAPKIRLPGHGESYNPPIEYLPLGAEPPDCLRRVPGWKSFVKDRWERCLDLYCAPRQQVMRVTASAKDLIPELPKPQDLRPFPTVEGLIFRGHRSIIRSISIHPLGKFLASGSDDQTVKIWEISTGRCLRSFDVEAAVKCVAWNPSNKLFLLGIVLESKVIFMNPETYLTDKVVVQQTNSVFKEEPDQGDYIQPERVKTAVTWRKPTGDEWAKGYRVVVDHFRSVKQIVWHKQGDYFATVIPEGDHRSVLMHQLSRWRSQVPFNKCKGRVQTVQFHPKLPFLFVVTQGHIRVYNLQKQRMLKKVQANSRWISSIAIHPGGEHFLIGGYDRKLNWFEMECTRRPHLLRYHRTAVRSVAFHRKYPLFASAADEGRVIISHGMVYNDWLKDPFLVPVKELKGHSKFEDYCVLDLTWHPYEPYLFTAGADSTIRLWH